MTNETKRRLAANEAVFREVNEAIERGHWPGEEDAQGAFRCECARRDCAELISLTPREYEHIRSNSRRFVVRPGHENPELETVVERTADYVVVEKLGDAAREAEVTDPRS
jgi:hypothetical protein